jgi:SWI/SNF-related matrix-associated actin-dependent regulator 1 of chromatin subfamily A
MRIIVHPTEFHVEIPYGRFQTYQTNQIKLLFGSRFDWTRKLWIVPKKCEAEMLQIKNKCRADWEVFEAQKPQVVGEILELPELDFEVPIYHPEGWELRHYQKQGIARGLELKRFINCFEQGLGKTGTSCTTLKVAELKGEDVFPALVICPSSTKINWQREWHMWTDKKAMVLDTKTKDTWHRFHELGMNDVFITNFESLKKFFVKKMPAKGKMRNSMDIELDGRVGLFKSIIIDESHRMKSPSTLQAKLGLRIAMGKEWILLLTGTPVVNKPIDLYAQLAIMGRLKEFGGRKGYLGRYCEGGRGSANLKELNYLLNKTCFFRKEKSEVAKDLPEKQRQTILCDITTRNEYNKAQNDFVNFLKEKGCDDAEIAKKLRGEIMVKMGELKRISAKGKMNEVIEFVNEVTESGEKLIVFCVLHEIVDELLKEFPFAVTVTGRDNSELKQANIDKFQNDINCKLIVCNIRAAGVGITLTASSRVAFVEYPWTYADCVQCEDRAHRIGQKNNVMCTYFLGNKTIDEDLYKMIQEKRHTANAITGATDKMEMSFVDNVVNLFNK